MCIISICLQVVLNRLFGKSHIGTINNFHIVVGYYFLADNGCYYHNLIYFEIHDLPDHTNLTKCWRHQNPSMANSLAKPECLVWIHIDFQTLGVCSLVGPNSKVVTALQRVWSRSRCHGVTRLKWSILINDIEYKLTTGHLPAHTYTHNICLYHPSILDTESVSIICKHTYSIKYKWKL